nr:hypothetical protein [Tanacetum cinerariifolium]
MCFYHYGLLVPKILRTQMLMVPLMDLRDEFEDFFVNNTNRVNAASAPVTTVGPNPTNNTNSFTAASPSDNALNMPALEDIVYSDDKEDVGTEADFSNLETNISFSPIPTTRLYKDHPVTQIIGELTSVPETRSMERLVKEQEFDPDKVYKVVKALYGLHQAPRAWYETLANYLLENSFQRGKIDQTLFIKKQQGNILLVQVETFELPMLREGDSASSYAGAQKGLDQIKDPTLVVMEQLHLLKKKHLVVGERGLGCHNLMPFVFGERVANNMCFYHYGLLVPKILKTQMLMVPLMDLRDEFEDFFVNSTNRVNAASAPVTAVGPNPTNSTNSFTAASPSDNAVNMPALEDIVYSDDKEDVGAEADFSNLETNISFSPISTTRLYKDHPVTEIIGELTSAPQTRSMERLEEGIDYEEVFAPVARIEAIQLFFSLCFLYGFHEFDPDKVYKVVKALYGLHQAPRAWYETLANYLLENSFQRGKIDQTLFIKKQQGNILLVQVYVDDIIFGSTNKELCKVFEMNQIC